MLAHIPLVTMPLKPLKLLRMSTGLLYSQYFTVPSRLNIARRYYLPQVRCSHVTLDAHSRTAGCADLHCKEALLILLELLLFAFGLLCRNGRIRPGHHRHEPGWNQRLRILLTVPAFPPVVLMPGYSVFFQILLLADVLLLAFPIDCSDFFSCHHLLRFFAKVAQLSPGYNMQFIGCLHIIVVLQI